MVRNFVQVNNVKNDVKIGKYLLDMDDRQIDEVFINMQCNIK